MVGLIFTDLSWEGHHGLQHHRRLLVPRTQDGRGYLILSEQLHSRQLHRYGFLSRGNVHLTRRLLEWHAVHVWKDILLVAGEFGAIMDWIFLIIL